MADATKKPDDRWLTDPASIEKRPSRAPDPYWVPPTPPSGAELWPTRRPGDAFSAANPELERMAADLGIALGEGDWRAAGVAGAGLMANLTQGKVRPGAKPKRADVYRPGSHNPDVRELQGPGFYSHMLAELKDMDRGGRQQGSAASWMNELERAQVKPKEISGSGMDRYLAEQDKYREYGPITRHELEEFARANQPHIEEKRFGPVQYEVLRSEDGAVMDGPFMTEREAESAQNRFRRADDLFVDGQLPRDVHGDLKWGGSYGGQDFVLDPSNPTNREYVLGLKPSDRAQELDAELARIEGKPAGPRRPDGHNHYSPEQIAQMDGLRKELHVIRQGRYTEPHFREVMDYIGHGRGSEVKLATGEKSWLIDENQNTRAQKIRDTGGRNPADDIAAQKRVDDAVAKQNDLIQAAAQFLRKDWPDYGLDSGQMNAKSISDIMLHIGDGRMGRHANLDEATRAAARAFNKEIDISQNQINLAKAEQKAKLQGAPGHPLVDDIPTANRLGLRHQLLQTKDKDVAGVTLTPGDLQNERYGKETEIEGVTFVKRDPSGYLVNVTPKEPRYSGHLIEKEFATPKEVEAFLGPELGQRVVSQAGPEWSDIWTDTKIGGQGMRDYYDRQYPDILNSELKRLSGGDYPGQQEVDLTATRRSGVIGDDGKEVTYHPAYPDKFHHFPFTDKIRGEIKKGLPFYGLPIAAGAASWMSAPEDEQRDGFADGGMPRLPRETDLLDYTQRDPTLDQWQPPQSDPGEIRAPRRLGDLGQEHNEELARDIGDPNVSWWRKAAGLGEIMLGAVPGVGFRRRKTNRPTLEQGVEEWGSRPSTLDYETYLGPKDVPRSLLEFETQEPGYKNKAPPQEVKNLRHYRIRDEMREKRDEGLLEGPEGYLVNPWYWPNPVKKAFKDRLGDTHGEDQFKKFMGFNAATSMQTAVPRNIVEAWMLYHHDMNEIPFKKFSAAEMSGAATNNKILLGNKIATGEGLTTKDGPKVRNYWLNLQGAGAEPHYVMTPTGYEAVTQPVTLDKMMAEAMRYRRPEGEPRERFVGAPYRHGVDVVNDLAREVGAAAPDTQAAIWQMHQKAKLVDDQYNARYAFRQNAGDPYARIFDDVIHRIAHQEGVHPERILDELIEGRRLPPNFWYTQGDGKAEGGSVGLGGWETSVHPEIDLGELGETVPEPSLDLRTPIMGNGIDDPYGYGDSINRWFANGNESIFGPDDGRAALMQADREDFGRYDEARQRKMEPINHVGRMAPGWKYGPNDRESSNAKYYDRLPETMADGGRIGDGMTAPASLEALPRDFDPYWLPPEPRRATGEIRMPRRPGDLGQEHNEDLARRIGDPDSDWLTRLGGLSEIVLGAAFSGGKGKSRGPKEPSRSAAGAGSQKGELPERGGVPGGNDRLPASRGASDSYTPLPGQPATTVIPGHGEIEARPLPGVQAARDDYLSRRGLPLKESMEMPEFNVERARRIAQAYEDMKHDPTNPDVRRAYDSMINETLAQLDALERQGYRFKFNKPGEDPYKESPALGYLDVRDKGELSVFPTLEGFGSGVKLSPAEVANNPLLTDVGRKWESQPITANDAFRGVHDMFGHFGFGNPFFRHKGEERAWGHHVLMYPPSAQGAMTSETRGQNSWLNFGPHGERNKTASGADTIYADQKTGLMPEWTWTEGIPPIREGRVEGGAVKKPSNDGFDFSRDVGGAMAMADKWPLMGIPSSIAGLNPFGSHASILEARERAIDEFRAKNSGLARLWGEASEYPGTPTALGAFIGLPGIRKLEQAGKLHPDDWRGSNRWDPAKKELGEGRPPQEVWAEHGVAPPDAFKGHPHRPTSPDSQHFTVQPLSDVELPESFLRMIREASPGSGVTWQGPFGHSMIGPDMDDFLTAVPELKNVPTYLKYNPGAEAPTGNTNMGGIFRQPKRADSRPIGLRAEQFDAGGANTADILNVMRHEAAHGAQAAHGVPDSVRGSQEIGMRPIQDTVAKQRFMERANEVQQMYTEALHSGNVSPADLEELKNVARFFYEKARTSGTYADYLGSDWEKSARAAMLMDKTGNSESALKRMYPGAIDTYAPDALDIGFEQRNFAPLWTFMPPTKAHGGAIDEASIRDSYSDHDLGYGRHPLDDDYQEWRQRASAEQFDEDLKTFEVTQAMHDIAGYRPSERLTANFEDRRLDGDRERAHHQFLVDQMSNAVPSYEENYGPLPGPDLDSWVSDYAEGGSVPDWLSNYAPPRYIGEDENTP